MLIRDVWDVKTANRLQWPITSWGARRTEGKKTKEAPVASLKHNYSLTPNCSKYDKILAFIKYR